ncbi:hypothetical protein CEXT_551651 [Caerostris extrusa]|uniref:Uncharacterized protein n=1 Tax=Caerostris extrusa TaxID=172846 RepID=A0AAV4SWX1_CAEEX|nr:hypothetical protein CEXT_551651 [Caerostris extrusa]
MLQNGPKGHSFGRQWGNCIDAFPIFIALSWNHFEKEGKSARVNQKYPCYNTISKFNVGRCSNNWFFVVVRGNKRTSHCATLVLLCLLRLDY